MALCKLCQSIPFASIPSVPKGLNCSTRLGDNKELPVLFSRTETKDELVQLKGSLGFAWHQCFDMLAESARTGCPLCTIVQTGVQIWLDHFQEVEQTDPAWHHFYKKSFALPKDETLWLTKRFGGGDGFIVLTRNPIKKGVYFITGVNFTVEAGSPMASKLLLRPIERDSGSRQTLDIAASLVSNCIKNHERCDKELTPLPSRVIDVNSTDDTVRLIDCPADARAKYISLSHCWGSTETLTTTQESYEARTKGIPLSHLPKTFFDTIIIARHLGIRYVWIDSLCIMQEDVDDWARESGRMRDVYSNAYVVVAANHARNDSEGCFHKRPGRTTSKVTIPELGETYAQLLYPGVEWTFGGIDFVEEPLSGRGWALQERVLARRILHYNTSQIYLECNHGIVGEDGCRFEDRYCCNLGDLEEFKEPKPRKDSSKQLGLEHTMWNSLLWSYGNRKLTKATDKLPAMSGIAKLLKSRLDAQYVAGIWSDALIEGLAWQGIGNRAPPSTTEYTGPSWSWASYDGIAATGLRGEWKDVAKVEDWQVELQNEANPFGSVRNAWIRIHGPLAELKPSEKEITDHEVVLREMGRTPLPRLRTRYSDNEEGSRMTPDHDAIRESRAWREWNMQVLILCGRKCDDEETNEMIEKGVEYSSFSLCYGLVIAPTEYGRMKRVGWMFLQGEEARNILEDKECWRDVILV